MLKSENGDYFKLIFSSTQIIWSFDFFYLVSSLMYFFKYVSEEDIKSTSHFWRSIETVFYVF